MKRICLLLSLAALLLPFPLSAQQRYHVGVCDWMVLKRQKLGEFQLARDLGADGVELDMGGLGQRQAGNALLQRVAAGQGEPRQKRIFSHPRNQIVRFLLVAAGGIMGFRIVAAGAVMRAALGKHREPQPRAIHDAVVNDARNTNLHELLSSVLI